MLSDHSLMLIMPAEYWLRGDNESGDHNRITQLITMEMSSPAPSQSEMKLDLRTSTLEVVNHSLLGINRVPVAH